MEKIEVQEIAFDGQCKYLMDAVNVAAYLKFPDQGMGLLRNVLYSNPNMEAPVDAEMRKFADAAARVDKFGHVYIIEGTHKGITRHKIGKANDLKDRIKTFSVKIPFDIKVVASFYVIDPLQFESALHDIMRHKRIAGEWFDLEQQDVYGLCATGMARESLDMANCITRELKKAREPAKISDSDYIDYLESVLVMNGIDFKSRLPRP